MKLHNVIIVMAAASVSMTSCFKDEPLNAECDIEQATVHVDNPEAYFAQLNDSMVIPNGDYRSSEILFHVRSQADLTHMAPSFVLTPGATISPVSGTARDFSNGALEYVTTSQDGAYHRTYRVGFKRDTVIVNDTINYDFESHMLHEKKTGKVTTKYYEWLTSDEEYNKWATGNPGYALSPLTTADKYEEYPTTVLENGYRGNGVKLTTCETGPLAKMQNPPMPMAAGNLFLGTFNSLNAFNDALSATQFGVIFNKKPVKLMGYYKYRPEKYELNGDSVTDEGTIYAVLYRREFTTNSKGEPTEVFLNGRDVQTNPRIVALAKMPAVPPTDTWTPFEVEFDYDKDVDDELLANNGYNLTIVFSSSINGAFFKGGIGSTLCIDEVKLVCAHKE